MATVTTTTLSEALKTDYLPGIRRQINDEVFLYNKIKRGSEDIVGDKAVIDLSYGRNLGVGAFTETGALPTAGSQSYKKLEVTTANLAASIELSHKSQLATRSDRGAFVRALESELEGCVRDFKWDVSRQGYNDAYGTIAVCGTTSNSVTVNLRAVDSQPERFVNGMTLDIVALADGTAISNGTDRIVSSVDDDSTPAVVLTTSTGVTTEADTHGIVKANSYGIEMLGLKAWVGTVDNTIGGVVRSTAKWFNPNILDNSGTARALSLDLMRQARTKSRVKGQAKINLILCSHGVQDSYGALLEGDRRHVNTKTLDGGWTALEFEGIDVVADHMIDRGTMYFLDLNDFKYHQLQDIDWLTEGNEKMQLKQGYAIYQASLVWYANLTCKRPNAQTVLKDISE